MTAAPIASDLLGALDLPAEARLHFADGLYGFPDARDWALVAAGRDGLWWLQSADEPGLTLLVADPFGFFPDYAPDVPDGELAALGAGEPDELAVFAVVTLGGGGRASANLRAPLVVDTRTRRGRQVVLPAERRGVAEPLRLD